MLNILATNMVYALPKMSRSTQSNNMGKVGQKDKGNF